MHRLIILSINTSLRIVKMVFKICHKAGGNDYTADKHYLTINHFFQGTFSKIVFDHNLNLRIQCGSNENIPLVFQDWMLAYKVHGVFSFNNKLVWIFMTAHSSLTWSFLLPSWSKRYFNSPVDLHQAEEHSPSPSCSQPAHWLCKLPSPWPWPHLLTLHLPPAHTACCNSLPSFSTTSLPITACLTKPFSVFWHHLGEFNFKIQAN